MNLSEVYTKLHSIERDVSALSGLTHSFMITSGNENRRFETYLRMIAKKQVQMQHQLEMIVANLEIRTAWDNEEDLDQFCTNFDEEF